MSPWMHATAEVREWARALYEEWWRATFPGRPQHEMPLYSNSPVAVQRKWERFAARLLRRMGV